MNYFSNQLFQQLYITVFLLILWIPANSQLFHPNLYEFDDNGKRHGRWIEYYDNNSTVVSSNIKYRHGYEDGICRFYHPNGELRLKWRYYKKRIRAKYYYESGKLEQKGWSKIEYGGEDTHYYWHGKWKFYDENKKLVRTANYKNGKALVE